MPIPNADGKYPTENYYAMIGYTEGFNTNKAHTNKGAWTWGDSKLYGGTASMDLLTTFSFYKLVDPSGTDYN